SRPSATRSPTRADLTSIAITGTTASRATRSTCCASTSTPSTPIRPASSTDRRSRMQFYFSIYDANDAAAVESRLSLARTLPGGQVLLRGDLSSALKSWAPDRQLPGASAVVPAYGELLVFKSDVAAADAFASPAG